MGHLVISFFAAFAVAIAVYSETQSLLYALLAYSGAGTLVMLTSVLSTMFALRDEDGMEAQEG